MRVKSMEFAQLSTTRQIDRKQKVWQTAALCACLENAACSAKGLCQSQTLHNIFSARFLTIDVLPCIGGHDSGSRVPVGAGGNEHRIDIATSVHVAQIAIH